MAKDAKGHGSEKRGGGGFVQGLQPMTPDQQKTLLGRTTPLDSGARASFGGGQPVASNAHAAATLASGLKSAAVDTHPAMAAAYAASAALARGDFPLADATRRANGLPHGNADQPGWKPAKGTEARYAAAVKMRDPTTHMLLGGGKR
jgi:hypothetical protein